MPEAAVLQESPSTEQAPDSQPPKASQKRFYFTKENARMYSLKGNEAYRKKLEDARKPLEPAPNDPPELKYALADCARLSSALDSSKLKPLERVELSKALDRALDRVRIIRGQALPGTATSRAPAPAQSPASSMLSTVAPTQDARPARDEQE